MAAVASAPGHAPRRRVPKKAAQAEPMSLGRIERLIVENFKSYEGRHVIGPFDKFTCIIGPNGSGKSNIMDAISFCLGIRAKHLRGERLKDLVYRREEEDVDKNTRSASVTLEFRAVTGELLLFGRMINSRGHGSYIYGTSGKPLKNVTYDELLKYLAEQHIHVKARNFLVFQGDVMELARRQGQDLTGMLETISGSDQLKENYDLLSRELETTQEKARTHFQHRREVESTVSVLSKQRAEVERYHELRTRRNQLQEEAVLFKLYCAERETDRCNEAAVELRAALKHAEDEYRAFKKQTDEVEEALKRDEADAEETKTKHFVLSSNLEQIKTEIGSFKKQVTHWQSKLKEKDYKIKEEQRRQKSWQLELNAAHEERRELEQKVEILKSKDIPSAIALTPEQRKEYEQAVARTDAANSKAREQHREAEEKLRVANRELQSDRRELKELHEQNNAGVAKFRELGHERERLEHQVAEAQSLLEERRKQVDQIAADARKFVSFKDSLLEEQRTLRFNLDAARARREKLEHLEAKERIADELRDAFPKGVIGRLSELVVPTQKRFDLPLQMSLGSMTDAFVVTDVATGRDCVNYLKTKRISTETFLPLERMEEPKAGPMHSLTEGSDVRRVATMCVQHNDRFLERHKEWRADGPKAIDKALNFLLDGTIIVDDLDEAKATAYRDARKKKLQPRVVTLAGEVIAPNGNMMIQSIPPSGRVQFGGTEHLHEIRQHEQKLGQVDRDIASLQEELRLTQQKEAEVRDQTAQLEERQKSCELRLRAMDTSRATEQKLSLNKETRIEELTKKIEKNEKAHNVLSRQASDLEEELLRAGKKNFARLNRSLGVDDVREILQKEQKEKRQLRDQIEEHEDQIRTLVTREKSLAQRVQASASVDALKRDCEQYKRDIFKAQQREAELEVRLETLAVSVEESKARLDKLMTRREQAEHDLKTRRNDLYRTKAKAEEVRKKNKLHNEKVRAILSIRVQIFRECDERSVAIPFRKSGGRTFQQALSRSRQVDDMPFEDLEAACRSVQVDYRNLSAERKEQAAQIRVYDARAVEAEYEAQLADIAQELESLSPNMRAIEQHDVEESRLKEIKRQADEATAESQRLTREFEAVKAERIARFMDCFKHVESCVHPFYKELTSYEGHEGGSAYLDLDDAEEPYNGGITFTACPPGKRFFPMELLSGGERSMASMALLFAMHSYKPPPFMILDEVDAPFDRKNTNSLVNYLRKLHFQCLVISLKDSFFSQSDTLIGIFKDKQIQSSGSVSLSLRKLGQESETPETERPVAESGDVD